jgi:DNA-binding SARP family transcriptional activator
VDPLTIRLFGEFNLSRGDQDLSAFPTRQSQALFSFLVLHRGRCHSREFLLGTFWAETAEGIGRKRLRTEIWRVRRVVEPAGVAPGTYVRVRNHELGFNTDSRYWLDIEQFESRLDRIGERFGKQLSTSDANLLAEAVQLYRGDLLEGLYADWCLWEQERLKLMFLEALEKLMVFHSSRHEWKLAILRAQELLSHDPLREHIHRELMHYFYRGGNRPAAIRQYQTCLRLLREELDVAPMQATRDLYESIANESHDLYDEIERPTRLSAVDSNSHSDSRPNAKEAALSDLHRAAESLETASTSLRRGMTLLDRLLLDD